MECAMIYCQEDAKYPVKADAAMSAEQFDFMVHRYPPQDFRYPFVQCFIPLIKERLHWEVYNCKLVYNPTLPLLLDVRVYLEDAAYDKLLTEQLESDKSHPLFGLFYEAYERFPLPAIDELSLRMHIVSAHNLRMSRIVSDRFAELKRSIASVPFVDDVAFWSNYLCVILKTNADIDHLRTSGKLEKLRRFCYLQLVHSPQFQRELPYEKFHIKADSSGVYQDRGSRWFFDSDAYVNATII